MNYLHSSYLPQFGTPFITSPPALVYMGLYNYVCGKCVLCGRKVGLYEWNPLLTLYHFLVITHLLWSTYMYQEYI